MTDDRSLERAARSWLEAGPTEAPDRAVEAALLRIHTTPQERDLRIPWRLPKMTTPARVAAAAIIGVLAVGGSIVLFRPGTPVGGTGPSPTASASPIDLIPEGTFASAPLKVADLIASINADPTLTAAQKTFLIDVAFEIKGHTTFSASIELRAGQWTQRQTVDGATQVGSRATYSFEGTTLILRETAGVSRYEVTRTGSGFTLKHLTPGSDAADRFTVKALFESAPFMPVP
jgi:hypothetical protein